MPDLSCGLLDLKLPHPLILASGILGSSGNSLVRLAQAGAAATITKSITIKARSGHPGPTIVEPAVGILINAIGLTNPGASAFLSEIRYAQDHGVIVIPSIAGEKPADFAQVAEILDQCHPPLYEINVSCPHPKQHGGGGIIGQDPQLVAEIVSTLKAATKTPLIVKLTPNVTDIVEIAEAAVKAGADALSAINTLQALEVDPYLERPTLGNFFGGQSGPSIRLIAQRKIFDLAFAMKEGRLKKVPLVAVGGINSGLDVARFILLGAQAVQIGSAIHYHNYEIFQKCFVELIEYMEEKGFSNLDDFRGKVLENIKKAQK